MALHFTAFLHAHAVNEFTKDPFRRTGGIALPLFPVSEKSLCLFHVLSGKRVKTLNI